MDLAARPHIHSIVGGGEGARTGHGILRVHRVGNLLWSQPELRELRVGDLHIDTLLLIADEVDLVDIRHAQQLGSQTFRIIVQLGRRETVALQCIDVGVHVAELIVEVGPLNSGGQRVDDIADLLANLVPGIRHPRRRCGILDGEEQSRLAGPRVAAQKIHIGSLLQLARDPIGHFLLHLPRRRTGPRRADHHDLEGERRILGLRELAVGQHAEQRQQRQQENHQRLMPEGPARQIEAVIRARGGCSAGRFRAILAHCAAAARAAPPTLFATACGAAAPSSSPSNKGLTCFTCSPA